MKVLQTTQVPRYTGLLLRYVVFIWATIGLKGLTKFYNFIVHQ